ncbi:MAG: SEC-C domain-containing protein [Lactobacillales bacterium]|nr:SEC-C domain-containing protein [Lactobacillales bacterium]
MPKGQAIDHPWISKAIAKAQQKVEAYHFDLRKDILKYDDVMNEQRQIIYAQRREMMEATDITDIIKSMRDDCIENTIYTLAPEKSTPEDWDEKALTQEILNLVGLEIPFSSWLHEPGITPDDMRDRIIKLADQMIDDKMKTFPVDLREKIEKNVLIQTIDQSWKEHLQMLDFLKTSIGLRAYAQKNPLNEYKQEAFYLFESMLGRVRERATHVLCLNEFQIRPEPAPMLRGEHQSVLEPQNKEDEENFASAPAKSEKTGRNSPCPCGSGKKSKHCCGKLNYRRLQKHIPSIRLWKGYF